VANRRLLIVYYSESGNTKRMAEEIGRGAGRNGVDVELKKVEDCNVNDLLEPDGIVIGSPTYFSNVAWQVKKLIDESITLYNNGRQLKNKIGGFFTSTGTQRDGKDCVRMLELAFGFHHKLQVIRGIVGVSDGREEEISEMCQQYGEEIARKILS
jgi:NAD(P)H dehydrogenase (quinone)